MAKKPAFSAQPAENQEPALDQPAEEPAKVRRRVLIVDDSKAARNQIGKLLESLEVECFFASNGVEGARLVYLEQPNLVISDVVMPELNGFQLCRLIKNDPLTQAIPVIMLTGLGKHQDRFWGLQAGADRYINKTEVTESLAKEAEVLLNTSRAPSYYDGSMSFINASEVEAQALRNKVTFLLDKLLFESTVANETKHLAAFMYNRERFIEEFFGFFGDLVEYDAAALALLDENNAELAIDARKSLTETDIGVIREDVVRMLGNLKLMERLRLHVLGARDQSSNNATLRQTELVPLRVGHDLLGTLAIYTQRNDGFSPAARTVIDLVAYNISMVIKLLFLYEENRWLSIVDPLTKVYNRRYFKEALKKEFDRSNRYGNALALLFVDIDNFKLINDTYGHHQGDLVLRDIAAFIAETVRKTDITARYGGEEFVVLLPETPLQAAAVIAERLRAGVEEMMFGLDEPFRATMCVGVSAMEQGAKEFFELVEMADTAMYEAKTRGKNRVCTALHSKGEHTRERIRRRDLLRER